MINLLFCGNDKVFDGMLTTMLSIFERTKLKLTDKDNKISSYSEF